MSLYEEFAECGPLQGFIRQYIFLPLLVMYVEDDEDPFFSVIPGRGSVIFKNRGFDFTRQLERF
jgi:hypothetical protein